MIITYSLLDIGLIAVYINQQKYAEPQYQGEGLNNKPLKLQELHSGIYALDSAYLPE